MRMRKKLLWLLVLVVSVLMVVTLSQVVVAEPVANMLFIVKSMDNPFWDSMLKGAQEAAADLNIEIEGLAPITPYSVEEQLRFMEIGITKGVDAIIVVPADSRGIVPGIEKANEAGIVVVTPNTRADGGEVVSWDGAANFDAAYEVSKYLLTQLKDDCKVIILEGTPGNQTATDRKAGIDEAIKESKKNIKVLASQTAKFSRVEGMNVMENLLQQFAEIDAVICANDEMALGAIEAIDAAGRLDKIKVSGFDGNNDAMNAINEGRLVVTGNQRPDAQAYWGVLAAFVALKGMPCPKDIYIPAPLVTKDNVSQYLK